MIARWATGRNWKKACRGARRDIPRDFAVLWAGRPVAAGMAKGVDEEHAYYQFLCVMIVAFMKGTAPSMAVDKQLRQLVRS